MIATAETLLPMPPPVLIHVAPVTPTLASGVRAVQVSAEQAAFVGNTAFNLLDAQSDPASEPMAIRLQQCTASTSMRRSR